MTIAFVRGAHGGGTATSATTLTIPFDATSCDGLVVGIRDIQATLVTGVTYNGAALTLARHDGLSGASGTTMYVGTGMASGTHDVVISFSGSYNVGAVVAGFSGVDQASPVGNVAGHSSIGGTPYSDAISVTSGNVAVDFISMAKSDTTSGPVVVSPQTLADSFLATDSSYYVGMSYSANATAMAWTFTGPSLTGLSHSVMELKAAAVADTTAPTLTSPTSSSTGTTTGSGTVTTDEGNGTLYYLASVNATETAATVKAAASQAVTSTGVKSVSVTGLTASTTYYMHYVHRDAAGNDSTVSNSASFTTAAPGDTTPPALTSPTGTKTGSSSAAGAVSTDEANGTLYRLASTNATETAATVKAAAQTTAVTATGLQSVTFTGLTSSTVYYAHYVHRDAAGNDSTVANSTSFTTDAPPGMALSSYFISIRARSSNYADRVRDVTSTTGTGAITLANITQSGFRTAAAAYAVGTTNIPYCIEDLTGGAWETGFGTLTSSTTFSRDTVTESSSGNAAAVFAAGAKNFFVTHIAATAKRAATKSFIDLRDYPVDPTFTDDSSVGIQAAINDAFISGISDIHAPIGRYKIAGALQSPDGFGRGCNGQLYIPASDHVAAMKSIRIIGESAPNWGYGSINDEPVVLNGVIFESTLTAGTGTDPAVICASYGFDGGWGNFNFTDFTMENVCIRTNTSAGANKIGGINLYNLSNGGMLHNVRVDVNRGLRTNPDPTSLASCGIRTTRRDNSGAAKWGTVFVGGYKTGVAFSEHMFIDRLTVYGCLDAVDLQPAYHASWIGMLNVECCKNSIVINGDHALGVGAYDTEHDAFGAWFDFDKDIKLVASGSGGRKVAILSSTVVVGGVGISDAGWSSSATSANYKVVAGAGAN